MSLRDVKAFYERLQRDESFRDRISSVSSKEECNQIVKKAGYKFTQAEFEEYTEQLLESSADDDLRELDEQELEAVLGGAKSLIDKRHVVPMYGVVFPKHPPYQTHYGVVNPEI
jgi:predicted ribosomally synthesized peptide with nif11-like leader